MKFDLVERTNAKLALAWPMAKLTLDLDLDLDSTSDGNQERVHVEPLFLASCMNSRQAKSLKWFSFLALSHMGKPH